MRDEEEGGTRKKEGRGGRRDKEEEGTRRKEGRGGRKDEESEIIKKLTKMKMKKSLKDVSLTTRSCSSLSRTHTHARSVDHFGRR